MRQVVLTSAAKRHFLALRAVDRALLRDRMTLRLGSEDATDEDRNRFRLRGSTGFVAYELRVGQPRAFYRIDAHRVAVTMIGIKRGNKLIVEGQEVAL